MSICNVSHVHYDILQNSIITSRYLWISNDDHQLLGLQSCQPTKHRLAATNVHYLMDCSLDRLCTNAADMLSAHATQLEGSSAIKCILFFGHVWTCVRQVLDFLRVSLVNLFLQSWGHWCCSKPPRKKKGRLTQFQTIQRMCRGVENQSEIIKSRKQTKQIIFPRSLCIHKKSRKLKNWKSKPESCFSLILVSMLPTTMLHRAFMLRHYDAVTCIMHWAGQIRTRTRKLSQKLCQLSLRRCQSFNPRPGTAGRFWGTFATNTACLRRMGVNQCS